MALRDTNPFIDADLDLIITTFEKGMVKSRDADSVFVPFLRGLDTFEALPSSVLVALEQLPLSPEQPDPSGAAGAEVFGEESMPPSSNLVTGDPERPNSPEDLAGDSLKDSEETEEEEDNLKERVKEWIQECVPCDFRALAAIDAEFFSDIGDGWKDAFKKMRANLGALENLLGDVNLAEPFCQLGNMLKFHCVPDIMKMIFILSMFMDSMEIQISADLGIFDSFLTNLLSPLFNEMASNLDLIDEIALGPIRCVLSHIQKQINMGPQVAFSAYDAVTNEELQEEAAQRRRMRKARQRAEEVLNELESPASATPSTTDEKPPESQQMAERNQREVSAKNRRMDEKSQSALNRANKILDEMGEALSFIDKFQVYLKTATDFLEDKKDWLLDLLQGFIDTGTDWWNKQVSFASGKRDILTFISIMKAMVEAAKSKKFSCGSGTGDLTKEDIEDMVSFYQHPSEFLEITVENDNIVVRRNPFTPDSLIFSADKTGELEDEGREGETTTATTGGKIILRTGIEGPDAMKDDPKNIVIRRPISSCLKKITADEVGQVAHWIRQFEQEG